MCGCGKAVPTPDGQYCVCRCATCPQEDDFGPIEWFDRHCIAYGKDGKEGDPLVADYAQNWDKDPAGVWTDPRGQPVAG